MKYRIAGTLILVLCLPSLSGCKPLCEAGIKKYCEDPVSTPDPVPVVNKALSILNQFQQELALQAGNNSLGLRSFQSANLGDLFIYNVIDDSIQSYTGNVTSKVPLTDTDNEIAVKNLSSLSITFDWFSSYQETESTGYQLVDSALAIMFKNTDVHRVSIKLSVVEASLKQYKEPALNLSEYESQFGDNEVKANIAVTGILKGRLRMEFSTFDKNDVELDFSGRIVADNINNSGSISAGYSEETETSTHYGAIQESENSETVFAISYLTIDPEKVDSDFIDRQIAASGTSDDSTVQHVIHRYLLTTDGNAIAEYEIRQVRVGFEPAQDVKWYLSVKNVYFNPFSFSFTLFLEVKDLDDNIVIYHEDNVSHLQSGETIDFGVISEDKMLLKFANPTFSFSGFSWDI